MNYGNTVGDSVSYNSRLEPTSYTVNNVNYTNYNVCCSYPNYTSMTWTYDYYNDGRLHHAWDSTNNWFDRSYSYDHAARLSEASTFRRAEGLSPFPSVPYPDPYHQNLSYDVWGHLNRTGTLYTGEPSDVGTYVNNRRTGANWSYDADGNVTNDWSYQHTFDAAGKNLQAVSTQTVGDGSTQFPTQPAIDITQSYDGDGQSRKRVQLTRQNVYDDFDENHPLVQVMESTLTSYYVTSSVLGGSKVMELCPDGQGGVAKTSLWIYAGGQRIAKEDYSGVTFEHHNPATGSWVTTFGHSSYRITQRQERDPVNAEIPTSNPYAGQYSYVSSKWDQPLFIEGGDPFDYSGGFSVDGLPVSASDFARRTGNGSVGVGVFFNGRKIGFADLTGRSSLSHITVAFDVFLVNGADPELPEYLVDSFAVDFSLTNQTGRKFAHGGGPQNTRGDLPDYARSVYTDKELAKRLTQCINSVFSKLVNRNGIAISGANLLAPQRLANAPFVDDYSFTRFELAGGMGDARALGAFFSSTMLPESERRATGGIPGTVHIANDIPGMSVTVNGRAYRSFTAFQIKQKAYVHELGNILSYVVTGDSYYFGDPNGIPLFADPTKRDTDTGAALERCVYRTPRLIP